MTEFVAATCAKAGLDIDLIPMAPDKPERSNLVARLRPIGVVRRRIVLAPHLDTVGVDTAERFRPILREGRLHGRGACDTKGSVAAMLSAVLRVARSKRRPASTEIVFAGLVDEEHYQMGSRMLAKRGFTADLAIVGEPTNLRVVTAHKGNVWLRIETRGRAAHGSRPDLGRNAIVEMAQIVELLEGTYATGLKSRRHPLLGHPTVNVGTIHGGKQPNIVPDQCVISVDRRTLPDETFALVKKELMSLFRWAGVKARLVTLRVVPCPGLETSPQLPLVRDLLRAAGRRQTEGVDYFCDAAVLANAGIPSVVFGPGDIAQAHTRDEWVAVRQVESATGILERFLLSQP
jgi:acetylornithine deacetylase/succinyl-diaminopimelate desuccinylase-like protein